MLAKFGFTSPFTKRKNKESSSNNSKSSNIPTIPNKKSLLLPTVIVNHEATSAYFNSLNDNKTKLPDFIVSSSESSSGISSTSSSGLNNHNTNSSNQSHLSSRSTSPSELFNVNNMHQQQQATTLNTTKRKSSLPKISKLTQPTTYVNTSVSNSSSLTNNSSQTTTNSNVSSKLVQPTSISQFVKQSLPQPTQIKKLQSTTQQQLHHQQQQQQYYQNTTQNKLNMPSCIPSTSTQILPKTSTITNSTMTSTLNVKKSNTTANNKSSGLNSFGLSIGIAKPNSDIGQKSITTPSKIPSSFIKKTDKLAQTVLTDNSKLNSQQQQQQQQKVSNSLQQQQQQLQSSLTATLDLTKMRQSKNDKNSAQFSTSTKTSSKGTRSTSPKLRKPSLFGKTSSNTLNTQVVPTKQPLSPTLVKAPTQISPVKSDIDVESGYVTPNETLDFTRKSFKNEIQAVKDSIQLTVVDNDDDNNLEKQVYKQSESAPSIITKVSAFHNLNTIKENPSGPSSPIYQQKPMITFSSSNTLDRKVKPIGILDSEAIRLFSNSLERKKQAQQQQQQDLEVYIDTNNTRLTNSIIGSNCSTTSSNAGFSPNRKQPSQLSSNKNRISQDTILENPNVLFASLSNDNLSIVDKEKSIEAIECIEKSLQIQKRNEILLNERVLAKEKECNRLKTELEQAHSCVLTLKNHLDTNAQVVRTLEQTISNLTRKIHTISLNSQNKDKIINELKSYLDILANKYPKIFEAEKIQIPQTSLTTNTLIRHNSTESMSSINSLFSHQSLQVTSEHDQSGHLFKKKRNWFRSSFTKAFQRKSSTHSIKKFSLESENESIIHNNKRYSDVSDHSKIIFNQNLNNYSLPNSPVHQQITFAQEFNDFEQVQRQLREKESKLTDIRLEALTSAHQLDQLKEELNRMKVEMNAIKEENTKLKAVISLNNDKTKSSMIDSKTELFGLNSKMNGLCYDGSPSPTNSSDSNDSLYSKPIRCIQMDDSKNITEKNDGKRVFVCVYFGKMSKLDEINSDVKNNVLIGSINLTTKTKWDIVETLIRQLFIDYLNRIDPDNSLGLSIDSISHYFVGDMQRKINDTQNPILLPYGYLVGDHINVIIKLLDTTQNSLDSVAFEILVPKSTLQRYITLINEHKNLIICGHSQTGKTQVAKKIAEFIAQSIDFIDLKNKTTNDLKKALNNNNNNTNRKVIILDNLESLNDTNQIFDEILNIDSQNIIIIGTINNPNVTSINLHQNFKWVLFVNQAEPVKSFLKRFTERLIIENETKSNKDLIDLYKWIPDLWTNINRYIETYNSADLTLGPKIFQRLLNELSNVKLEFIDLWNNYIAPYMTETIREGIQAYGLRLDWQNPKQWLVNTSPLNFNESERNSLVSIEISDLDSDSSYAEQIPEPLEISRNSTCENESLINSSSDYYAKNQQKETNDKLINMVMKLQEVTLGNNNRQQLNSNQIASFTKNYRTTSNIPKSIESIL